MPGGKEERKGGTGRLGMMPRTALLMRSESENHGVPQVRRRHRNTFSLSADVVQNESRSTLSKKQEVGTHMLLVT